MKVDKIVQAQLDHLADSGRKAVGAKVCIVIAGGAGEDIGCGITALNDDGAQGLHHAMETLLTVAAAFMQKLTDGQCKVMVQSPEGLRPAGKGEPCDLIKRTKT